MKRAGAVLVVGLLLSLHASAFGRSKRLAEIDRYCLRVQAETSGTPPLIFSGPDPWVELDDGTPDSDDDAVAMIYTSGPAVRWVLLHLTSADEGWVEDISYYFREDGTIAKRERHVEAPAANVELDVTTYYQSGRVMKEIAHHHAMHRGRKNLSEFNDPDAPAYMTVDDLPFPDPSDLWRRLA